MILLTVGKQLPFDRLVRAVDAMAPELGAPVIGQIGKTAVPPRNIDTHTQLSAAEFEDLAGRAELIISHAGIGSVLLARRLRKPIILMPRRAALGEHRNDHQLATARQLEGKAGITIAWHESDLNAAVGEVIAASQVAGGDNPSLTDLRSAVAKFIAQKVKT